MPKCMPKSMPKSISKSMRKFMSNSRPKSMPKSMPKSKPRSMGSVSLWYPYAEEQKLSKPKSMVNGPLVSLWCPNAEGKWPLCIPMQTVHADRLCWQSMANGPLESLWCPYAESKWPHGVPMVSLRWRAKTTPKSKSKPKSTLSPSLCQVYVKSMLSTSLSPSLC
jgi:hypothetical protein